MSTVTGTTSNAFSYEGDYAVGARGRVTWTATYRNKEGEFFGMRNGQLEQMQDVSASDVDEAVKAAIELRWAGM
ncbi:MAG: TonB-dependent receptor [Rhodanobacter sp.]